MPDALGGEVYPHLSWLVYTSNIPFYQALQSQAFNSFAIIHRLYLYSNIYSTVVYFIPFSEGAYVYNRCTIWLKVKFTNVVKNVYKDVDFMHLKGMLYTLFFLFFQYCTGHSQCYGSLYTNAEIWK